MSKVVIVLLLSFNFTLKACKSADDNNQTVNEIKPAVKGNQIELKAKFIGWKNYGKSKGVKIVTALVNNTSNELFYLNFTCSWDMAFTTNLNHSWIEGHDCDKNVLRIYKLSPNELEIRNINVPFDSDFKKRHVKKFRVEFHLIKYRETTFHKDSIFLLLKDDSNIVWSNEIQL
jgi:hypothetical protein